MNVLHTVHENEIPLIQILEMCEVETTVYVYFLHLDTVFIKRIVRPSDVLEVCDKCAILLKHHPCVFEIMVDNVNGKPVLKVRCV